MLFDEKEVGQIIELVKYQLGKGYDLISFPDDSTALSVADLSFFNSSYDALEFCYENTTDLDRYTVRSAEVVLQSLEKQVQQNELINIKNIVMNQENFDYLKNQVKFTGFGESLENDLKTNIEKQESTFQLKYPHEFGKDETVATLNFRKSDQNDMYFFNNYHLSVKQDGAKDPVEQTFYVGKDNTFTLKEAYNLASGRAVNKDLVNKDGEGYNSWVQLNFKDTDTHGNYKLKHFTENYGFDLKEALNKHPIKELANEDDKGKLLESLQKGNRQSVTFLHEGKEQKLFVEANPQFKSITVYDGSMKRVRQDQKEGETSGESTKQEIKKDQKQKNNEVETPKAAKSKKRGKTQHIS